MSLSMSRETSNCCLYPTSVGENWVKRESGSHHLDELVAYHLLVTPAEKGRQKWLLVKLVKLPIQATPPFIFTHFNIAEHRLFKFHMLMFYQKPILGREFSGKKKNKTVYVFCKTKVMGKCGNSLSFQNLGDVPFSSALAQHTTANRCEVRQMCVSVPHLSNRGQQCQLYNYSSTEVGTCSHQVPLCSRKPNLLLTMERSEWITAA